MELIERYTVSKDWMTLTLFLAFFLVTLAKLIFPERFDNFIKLFYTNRYFKINQKTVTLTDPFNLILSVIHILSVPLLMYLALSHFSWLDPTEPKVNFIRIMLGYSLFFLIIYFMEKITADVFKIEEIVNPYLFYKITYRNFIALFVLPINIILIYGFQPSNLSIVITLTIILLLNTGILADFYRKKRKQLSPHWFYFILYLCIFEITPYFILYKVVTIA